MSVATEETPQPGNLEVGAHLAQKIRCQERVVADVVDFIKTVSIVTQDHVRGGAGRQRWVRCSRHKKAVGALAATVKPNDLASIVNASGMGGTVGQGIVEREVGAAAQEKAVKAARVPVIPDDLACVVDAGCPGEAGGQGMIECRESAGTASEEAVEARRILVDSDDLACVVDAECLGVVDGHGIIQRSEAASAAT